MKKLMAFGAALFAADHWAIRAACRDVDGRPWLLPLYGLVCVGLTVWYALLLRTLVTRPPVTRVAQVGLVVFAGLLGVAELRRVPAGSIDATTYAIHGFYQVERGVSPYEAIPWDAYDEGLGEQLDHVGYSPSHGDPSPYGPLWSLLEAGIWRVTGTVRMALFGFQVLGLAALAACAFLLTRLSPGPRAWALAAAFVLHPVVMIESAGEGHMDALAYAFVLAATWRARVRGDRLGWALLLALALNLKVFYGIFAPAVFATASAGSSPAKAVSLGLRAVCVFLATTALLYVPYWEGIETLKPMAAHAQNDLFATVFLVAAVSLALVVALGAYRRPGADIATGRGWSAMILAGAHWFPWFSLAPVGELLRGPGRGMVPIVMIVLVGRLGTVVYFVAWKHYGLSDALMLPLDLYRIALGLMVAATVVAFARRPWSRPRP